MYFQMSSLKKKTFHMSHIFLFWKLHGKFCKIIFFIYLVPPSKIRLFITVYIKIFSNLIKAAYNKNVFIKKTAKFRWYRRNFWKTETVTVTGYLKIKTRKPLFQKPTPVLKTLNPFLGLIQACPGNPKAETITKYWWWNFLWTKYNFALKQLWVSIYPRPTIAPSRT